MTWRVPHLFPSTEGEHENKSGAGDQPPGVGDPAHDGVVG